MSYKMVFKALDQLKSAESTKVLFVFDDVDDQFNNKGMRLTPQEAVVTIDEKAEIFIHMMPALGCLVLFDQGKYEDRGATISEAVDAVEVVGYRITKELRGWFQTPKDKRKSRSITLLQVVRVKYRRIPC